MREGSEISYHTMNNSNHGDCPMVFVKKSVDWSAVISSHELKTVRCIAYSVKTDSSRPKLGHMLVICRSGSS